MIYFVAILFSVRLIDSCNNHENDKRFQSTTTAGRMGTGRSKKTRKENRKSGNDGYADGHIIQLAEFAETGQTALFDSD